MKKGFLTLLLLIITALPALAATTNTSGPWGIDAAGFKNLSTALASPSTAGKTVVVSKPMAINTKTIPTDRELRLVRNGVITVNTGKTLTINSPVSIGRFQAFAGSGSVVFGPGSADEIKPEWFGAKADGVTDCTAALRKAITLITTAGSAMEGRTLSLASGVYKITDDLPIAVNSTGFKIVGASRRGTVIKQFTDNKPIISFPGGNTSEFEISNIKFTWANIQPNTNTSAVAISMDVTTSFENATAGVYNFSIHDCYMENGYRGIVAALGTSYTTALWGAELRNLTFAGFSGSALKIEGGDPNNRITGIYIVGSTGTEPLVSLAAQNGFTLDNLEVNNNFYGAPVLKLAQCSGRVGSVRTEVSTYTVADSFVFDIQDSWVRWDYIRLQTTTINTGAGNKWFVFFNSGSSGAINLGTLETQNTTLTSGIPLLLHNSTDTNTFTVDQLKIAGVPIPLSDILATTGAQGLYVNAWNLPKTAADIGDANKTMVASDRMIQPLSTTLTADRTITLPSEYATSSDLFEGKEFVFVRDAATPGAFTVQITADSPVVTLPVSVRAWVRIVFERYKWRVAGYGTLP